MHQVGHNMGEVHSILIEDRIGVEKGVLVFH